MFSSRIVIYFSFIMMLFCHDSLSWPTGYEKSKAHSIAFALQCLAMRIVFLGLNALNDECVLVIFVQVSLLKRPGKLLSARLGEAS